MVTNEELAQATRDQNQQKIDLKTWMPQVRKIVQQLQSSESQTKLDGLRKLEAIKTDAAIDALKFGAMQLEPSIARALVSKIKSIRSNSSCLALVEIALVDPNSEVGRLCVEGLKEYDEHFYVPELLRMIELPVELKQRLVHMPNGSLAVRQAFLSESMTKKEQTEILKLISVRNDNAFTFNFGYFNTILPEAKRGSMPHGIRINFPNKVVANNEQAKRSADYLIDLESKELERRNDYANELKNYRDRNAKILLSLISGISADASAREFWDWWPNFNETYTSSNKPVKRNYLVDDSNSVISLGGDIKISAYLIGPQSCLVAGTPIQTVNGLVDVEKLKIGDQVPSINIATGKLSLEWITCISSRTADASYIISFPKGETIQATGGHNWWVVGQGWTRSRDLKIGQFMRSGNSSVEITKIEKINEPIKVYNMIVDQNHTYFVGKNRIVSWDVTSLQPTLQTAPGQTKPVYITTK